MDEALHTEEENAGHSRLERLQVRRSLLYGQEITIVRLEHQTKQTGIAMSQNGDGCLSVLNSKGHRS